MSRNRDLKPDAQGRYRPYLGWKADIAIGDDGTPRYSNQRQHRFNLGTDKREAERRLARLRELWDENCRANGEEVWTAHALSYAERIARGEYRIEVPPLTETDGYDDPPAGYAEVIQFERDLYPSLDIVPADPVQYEASKAMSERVVADEMRRLEADLREWGALPSKRSLPEKLISGTFHEALDAYAEDIRTTAKRPGTDVLTPYGRLRLAHATRLKRQHPDVPLHSLTYDACQKLIAVWRNRPKGVRTDRPTSYDNARHHIGELMRFFRWLDATDKYQWSMPRGLERVSRKIPKTADEKRLSAITVETYSVEELAVLNRHVLPVERFLLYVGLNCAMGAAELGRLRVDDVLRNHRHEYAERLHFESTGADNFIRFLRPKTGVFGEWWLWQPTVQMLDWAIRRAGRIGAKVLCVTEEGHPWYNEGSTNSQATFANVWGRLLGRVRKSHPDFRRLPFGSLRDTLPDLMRHRFDDELASLCLAHGSPFRQDNLLECYGNKPFGRLHKALRKMEAVMAPVFEAAPADPTEERKTYLPIVTLDRIKAMLGEDKRPGEIAKECGVSTMTVYRVRKDINGGAGSGSD
ncbi:MAG TPA: hypothetical protein VFG68_11010 [Fimbriiglobus sp.]|nr:hypothetical protein [Fimbriiglobus sp.]